MYRQESKVISGDSSAKRFRGIEKIYDSDQEKREDYLVARKFILI